MQFLWCRKGGAQEFEPNRGYLMNMVSQAFGNPKKTDLLPSATSRRRVGPLLLQFPLQLHTVTVARLVFSQLWHATRGGDARRATVTCLMGAREWVRQSVECVG